jgi:molybdenum ABC transporter molybdate-binding protein
LYEIEIALKDRGEFRNKERAVRILISVIVLGVTSFAPLAAQARDLVVYGEPTLMKALTSVGTLWRARTGTRVNVFVAPSDLSYKQIDRGARCDVIFALAGAETDAAARNKIIHADTVRRVLRNHLALAGTDVGPIPAAEATLAEMGKRIAGKTLAISNPERDPAGARAVDLLRKLGIAIDGNKNVLVAESTAGVVNMFATGKAQRGIVYATDSAPFPLVPPAPGADAPPLAYVVAQARDPLQDSQPFLAFLKSAEAKATFKTAGLETIED